MSNPKHFSLDPNSDFILRKVKSDEVIKRKNSYLIHDGLEILTILKEKEVELLLSKIVNKFLHP